MYRKIRSHGRPVTMLVLATCLALSPASASAASKTRTGTMLINAVAGASCVFVAECLAFQGPTSENGPGCQGTVPRPGHPAAAGTLLGGNWAGGIEASILDVGGLPNPTLAFTNATSKIVQTFNTGTNPNLGHIFLDSECRRLQGASSSAAFSFRVPFIVKVPKGTKWVIGFTYGTIIQGITWTLTFP